MTQELDNLKAEQKAQSDKIDALVASEADARADSAALRTAVDGAVGLMQALTAKMQGLAATGQGATAAELQALLADAQANTAKLTQAQADATAANTARDAALADLAAGTTANTPPAPAP